MRVALDGTPLSIVTGGIRRYTEELAGALAHEFPQDEYLLVSDQPFSFNSAARNLNVSSRPPVGTMNRRWWSVGLPRALNRWQADVFHGTDFNVPLRKSPANVMTVHDLSPWMDPAWGASARIRRRTPWLLRLGLVHTVVTPTDAIRRQVIDRFRVAPERVVAIPLAAAAVFRPNPRPADQAQEPYLLTVGTLEPRKNLGQLIEAWQEVRKRHPVGLRIVGRLRHDGVVPAPQPGLEWLGASTDEELRAQYCGALAVALPSSYEGFGLPVVEAMQCGAPVLVAADPAMEEAGGEAALRVKGDWAAALEHLIRNPEARQELARKSLVRAQRFSWRSTARATRDVYAAAARVRE